MQTTTEAKILDVAKCGLFTLQLNSQTNWSCSDKLVKWGDMYYQYCVIVSNGFLCDIWHILTHLKRQFDLTSTFIEIKIIKLKRIPATAIRISNTQTIINQSHSRKIYIFLPLILCNCFLEILSKNNRPAARSIDSGGTWERKCCNSSCADIL